MLNEVVPPCEERGRLKRLRESIRLLMFRRNVSRYHDEMIHEMTEEVDGILEVLDGLRSWQFAVAQRIQVAQALR